MASAFVLRPSVTRACRKKKVFGLMDFYGSKGLQVGLTALTGANLSSRFMWCRGLQPSLNWADSYSCFKSFQPPQKALLLNSTVYRYSISFLLVSQIVGATLGYFLGKIVYVTPFSFFFSNFRKQILFIFLPCSLISLQSFLLSVS